ncbi:hypothetical protein GH714_032914 [Hevea brasiliensis]|uniref:valine--tRNA ligase n=1 Tax=Hevea brasiliensis TaxID=3981 RepID=A0A6A6L299_HEVBR|nr:hypothetical protein GH714_032914 [Hevea brasiliensis]
MNWYIEASKARLYHSGGDAVAIVAQKVLSAIRNARAEYCVEPAKRISASIVASEEVIQYISKEKEVLALLSRLDLQNVHFTDAPLGDANQSVHLVASEGLEASLPLADMVDISTEVDRLSKRLSKMQTEYEGLVARSILQRYTSFTPTRTVGWFLVGTRVPVCEGEGPEVERRGQVRFRFQFEEGFIPNLVQVHETVPVLGLIRPVLVPFQFVEKAPEEVVRGVREKVAEAKDKINLTKNRLAFLKSSVLVSQ